MPILLLLLGWETVWWAKRYQKRASDYETAQNQAKVLGRPLVVIGAPDRGVTAGYGCGDITIDLGPSSIPNSLQLDITKPLPFADDSVVVFVACVLEYVDKPADALRELFRISGGWLYVVRVEPWTMAAYLYPGAKQTLPKLGIQT